MSNFTRRGFLKGVAASVGAAAGARLAGGGRGLVNPAEAAEATEKSALLLLYFDGGYNALFPSADSFLTSGAFGVTNDNVTKLAGGLVVDKGSLGSLNDFAKGHMASIGVRHGSSDHGEAQRGNLSDGSRNYAIQLAADMEGDASIKIATVGDYPPRSPRPAIGNVSFQQINDMGTTISALGGGAVKPTTPGREVAALAMTKAQGMSGRAVAKNPNALTNFKNGYDTGIDTLNKPVKPFNFDELAKDYTGKATGNSTAVKDYTSRFVGAELMIRAGANVVTIDDVGPWDSHGDRDGTRVRNSFGAIVMPGLRTFMNRIQTDPVLKAMNIVVAIMGDFSRSLPGSDHQPNLTNTVIGKYVKNGTTGKVDGNVNLPPGTGGQLQFWSYISEALKVKKNSFGANPHQLIL
jgi:hypothetical protein